MRRGNLASQHRPHCQGAAPWVSAARTPWPYRLARGERGDMGNGAATFGAVSLAAPFGTAARPATVGHRRSFASVSHLPPQLHLRPPHDALCCRVGSLVRDSGFFLATEQQRGTASSEGAPLHDCPARTPCLPLPPSAQRRIPGDQRNRHSFRLCTSGQMGSENPAAGLRGTTNYWAPWRPTRHTPPLLGRPRSYEPPSCHGPWSYDSSGPSVVSLLQPGSGSGSSQCLWPLAARFLLPSPGNSGL